MGFDLSKTVQIGAVGAKASLLSLVSRKRAKSYVIEGLGKMPGIPAKVAQLLRGKFVSDEKITLEPLQESLVYEVLNNELGADRMQMVKEVSSCLHTASIGQTHKLTMINGEVKLVKIQYPGVAEDLEGSVKTLLGLMKNSFPAKDYILDLDDYEMELLRNYKEEVDYLNEGRAQAAFREKFNEQFVKIPEVDFNLSTSKVLVQEYISGQSIKDVAKIAFEERRVFCSQLIEFHKKSLFEFKQVHCDLHMDNMARSVDGKLIVYDFGSTLKLEDEHIHLIGWIVQNPLCTEEELIRAFVRLGFSKEKLSHIKGLKLLVNAVFREKNIDGMETEIDKHVDKESKWWFRTAGPAWFLLLLKSFAEVLRVCRYLQVNVTRMEWISGLPDYKVDFGVDDIGSLSKRNTEEFPPHFLFIQVYESSKEIVSMELPVRLVLQLGDVVPLKAKEAAHNLGINFSDIEDIARKSSFAKQELLQLKYENRLIKIKIT